MILSITGNIGSGKTTVAGIFKRHHFKVIDGDKIAHEILNKEALHQLKKTFGTEIFLKHFIPPIYDRWVISGIKYAQKRSQTELLTNKIDRKKLGNIVFSDKKKLKLLNKIIWPLIIKKIKEEIKKAKNKNIVIDGAMLIEASSIDLVDKLIVVKITKNIQLKRLSKKKRYTLKQIKKIISFQMPQKEKLKYADYIIDNNGTIKNTELQILKFIYQIKTTL